MPRAVKREREEDESAIPTLAALKEYPQAELAHMCLAATKKAMAATEKAEQYKKEILELAASLATAKALEKELIECKTSLDGCKKLLSDAEVKVKESAIAVALFKNADAPLKVLWDVLNDESYEGSSAAMSIINDPRCGLKVRDKYELSTITKLRTAYLVASPLSIALFAGNEAVVKAIINTIRSAGADVVSALNESCAVDAACMGNSADLLAYVLSLGADPKIGMPLIRAAIYGNVDCIQILVKDGADLNRVDGRGKTALHFAVINDHLNDHLPAVNALLRGKVSLDIKCNENKTPLDYAQAKGNAMIIAALEAAALNRN